MTVKSDVNSGRGVVCTGGEGNKGARGVDDVAARKEDVPRRAQTEAVQAERCATAGPLVDSHARTEAQGSQGKQ